MAQVGIKSAEGYYFSLDALAQTDELHTRVGVVRLVPFVISTQDCLEPEAVRVVLQPAIELSEAEIVLPVFVVQVSGTRLCFKLPSIRG